MKKLLVIALVLSLLLPASVFADDYRVAKHYALQLDQVHTGYNTNPLSFTSLTIDLFIMSDDATVYYLESQCVSGIFLCNGVRKMRLERLGDELMIVDGLGNYRMLKEDEETEELWIDFGRGFMKMQLIEPEYTYE